MKKHVLKTVIAITMMIASPGAYAQQRPDFTVCNCDSTSYSCTYIVKTTVTACNAVPNCISLAVTHTVLPGHCEGFAFTPPPGYSIIPSTVNFSVTNTANSASANFGYSSAFTFSPGNCHGIGGGSGEVTTFQGNGHSTYTVCADIITGKPGKGASDPIAAKATEKGTAFAEANINEAFNIYPNPSSGDVTLSFALDQQDEAGIEVYNSFREKVYSFKKRVDAAESNKLQVEGLTPGIYIVLFTTGQETTTHKFVVKP